MKKYKDLTPSDKQFDLLKSLVADGMELSAMISKKAFEKNSIGNNTFEEWDKLLWSPKYPLVHDRGDGSLSTSHLTKHCSFFGVYQILLPTGDGFEISYIGESGSGATKAEGDSKGTSIKDRLNSHFTDMRDGKAKFASITKQLKELQVRFVRLDRLVTPSYESWLIEKYEPICNSKGKIIIS